MAYRMLNNTFVNTASDCNPALTLVQSSNAYGGLFDGDTSTSWIATTLSTLGLAPEAGSLSCGTDMIKMNATFSIPNFPIGVFPTTLDSTGLGAVDSLGLGGNSALMNMLSSVGVLASRTYRYFEGWT